MSRKKKLIAWLVGGIILALGPVWGLFGTVVGMILAFGHLSEVATQGEVLANDISISLYSTAAGLIVCPFGIIIILVSAIKLSNMKEAPAVGLPYKQS